MTAQSYQGLLAADLAISCCGPRCTGAKAAQWFFHSATGRNDQQFHACISLPQTLPWPRCDGGGGSYGRFGVGSEEGREGQENLLIFQCSSAEKSAAIGDSFSSWLDHCKDLKLQKQGETLPHLVFLIAAKCLNVWGQRVWLRMCIFCRGRTKMTHSFHASGSYML